MSLFGTIYCDNCEHILLYEKYFNTLWKDLIQSYILWYLFDNSTLNLDHNLSNEEKTMLTIKIKEKINNNDIDPKAQQSLAKLLSLM